MDDFDLRDLLTPPLRYQSDLPTRSNCIPPHMPDTAEHRVLAMAYVLSQPWTDLYSAEQGLHRGTIFQQLDLPFEGGARE